MQKQFHFICERSHGVVHEQTHREHLHAARLEAYKASVGNSCYFWETKWVLPDFG